MDLFETLGRMFNPDNNNMKTDKDLLRDGRCFEALGDNWSPKPYYILHFKDGRDNDPYQLLNTFSAYWEAMDEVERLGLDKDLITIGNSNKDWL